MKENVKLTGNVIGHLVKGDFVNGKWIPTGVELHFTGHNIVTDAGDRFYAEHNTTKTLTVDFHAATGGIRLGSGTTGGGDKADTDLNTVCTAGGYYTRLESGYPMAGDTEANNTGDTTDTVTWYYYWSTTGGSATKINEGAIVNSATNPTAALSHFDFGTTFDKTTADTMQLFVNHLFSGV